MKPTVGRIVHVYNDSTPLAAIIVAVDADDAVSLAVFTGRGMYPYLSTRLEPQMLFQDRVPFSAEPKPGYWSWPPKV